MNAPGKAESALDDKLAEHSVVGFLRNNPSFLDQHPELLAELSIPHASGEAVSLLERQVSVLRDDNARLKQQLERVVRTARQNETLNGNIHALVLTLINAVGAAAIFEALEQRLREDFGADYVGARVFAEPAFVDASESRQFVGRDAAARGPFEALINSGESRCGKLSAAQREVLFEAAQTTLSAVTMPLAGKDWDGVLVIASNDAERYQADMGTEFLTYLKDVVVLVIDPWVKRRRAS